MRAKTYKETYKVTINNIEYIVLFVIWKGHQISAYLYTKDKCLHHWPAIKTADQAAAALLVHEYLKKTTETIIV